MNKVIGTYVFVAAIAVFGIGATPAYAQYDNWYTDSGYGALTDYTGAYDPYAGLYDNWYTDSGYGALTDYTGAYDPYAGLYDPYAGAYDPYAGAYDPYCSQDCYSSQNNQPVYDQNCGCMTYPSVQRSMAMYQPFTQQQYTQPPMPIQPPPIPSVCPP